MTISRLFLRLPYRQRHNQGSSLLARALNVGEETGFCSRSITTKSYGSTNQQQYSKDVNNNRRIILTLYRQMMQWCNKIDKEIPLSNYVPPLYLTAPDQLHPENLRLYYEQQQGEQAGNNLFPTKTEIAEKHITCLIHNSKDAKKLLRAVFKLNSDHGLVKEAQASTTAPEVDSKMRIEHAFDGIKSMNELSGILDSLQFKRTQHMDREDVKYHVGQVVRHKDLEYRGVITGWTRTNRSINDGSEDDLTAVQATSLTNKIYESDNPEDNIKYTVVMDIGDAHLHHSKIGNQTYNMGMAQILQSDLEVVNDVCLRRIRNTQISDYFRKYDTHSNWFVPNETLTYEYPHDISTASGYDGDDDETTTEFYKQEEERLEQSAANVITGIQLLADDINNIIIRHLPGIDKEKSASDATKLRISSDKEEVATTILTFFFDKMKEVHRGDVVLQKDRLESSIDDMSKAQLASLHLQQLLNFVLEVNDLLRQRNIILAAASSVETHDKSPSTNLTKTKNSFHLGDIVSHKHFGFRGVVVGWDPKPSVDVSRWDGLQHIDKPEQYPFYHVVPDHNDCIEAFGSERPSRYVCEANLEVCPENRRLDLQVDMDPHWTFDHTDFTYIPPDDLKFKHGEDLEDDGTTEKCLEEMKAFVTRLLVSVRDGTSSGDATLDDLAKNLSSDQLLALLKSADSRETATILSEFLKLMWRSHVDVHTRHKLDKANSLLYGGNTEAALAIFTEIVDEDPSYAEAWNMASTCEFMLGNLEASLAAAKRTVEILPTHFQALNGMGLVYTDMKELPSAVESFRKGLEIDPWSPVSSRLSASIETLKLADRLTGSSTNEE